jgi:hypothetical protein
MRKPDPRARRAIAVLAALAAVLAVATPAAAGSPKAVTIVSHVTFNPDGPNFGTFSATGPAVTSGVICAAGTFVDTDIRFAGFQSDRGFVQLQVDKTFTCDDDSGAFFVKMQIQANFDTGIETFTWVAKGGTGDYTALRGSGTGSTVPNPPIGNINTYEGFVLR